ncbi:thioesterase family protein [Agrobacterium burrii]|uniref:Thioesterase family protein n=1 Tax=Agrobacterium burrii TaxID=2815339 RepID=A0ABS3EKE0_9HYPH|nr:thioesterase family protein [Agrobacterium burrii]MBO0132222.1 thioesterase family protein [Agrobacterium burrii]
MTKETLKLWEGSVLPEWLDYNGHMTEHRYLQVFSDSSDALYAKLGVQFEAAAEGSYFTLETHIRHLAETHVGARLRTETEILGYDDKRLHLFHRLFDDTGKLLATAEHLALHVAHSRACAARSDMVEKVAAIFTSQNGLPVEERLGSVLRQPLRQTRLLENQREAQ